MSDLQDRASSDVNDTGTSETIDTPLTQRRSRRVHGFVYFISSDNYIKIGFSTRPLDRLRGLQTSHPETLVILGTQRGTRALETKLHKKFAEFRERGEWFQAAEAIWNYIDNHTIERKPFVEPKLSPEARAMVSRITRLRDAYDADSPMGHTCSNLLEQIPAMADYVRPAWASHEMQTLPYLIGVQMKRLATLKAASH